MAFPYAFIVNGVSFFMFMADHDCPRMVISNVHLEIFIAQALFKQFHNIICCIMTGVGLSKQMTLHWVATII